MADPYKPLQAGAPVTAISRTAYNEMLAMLRWWRSSGAASGAGKGGRTPRSGVEVLVRNDTGATVAAFSALGVDGVVVLPSSDAFASAARPCVAGVVPVVGTHDAKWVATLEPIADGAIGRGVLVGFAVVRVYIVDADDTTCKISADYTVLTETVYLSTAPAGEGAPLLWLDPAASPEDIAWAVVSLGAGGGGGSGAWQIGTLDGALTKDGSASVTAGDTTYEDCEDSFLLTGESLAEGTQVRIDERGGTWYVTAAYIELTVVTAVQVDSSTGKVQYKTTKVLVLWKGAEDSSWTTAGGQTTMTTQTVLTDIQLGTSYIQTKSRSLKIFPNGDESDWTSKIAVTDCPEE